MVEAGSTSGQGASIIEGIRQMIVAAVAANNAVELKQKINKIEPKNDQVKSELDKNAEQSELTGNREGIQKGIPGEVGDESSLKHQVAISQVTVQEAIAAYHNEKLIPSTAGSIGTLIIKKIAEKITHPESEISPQSAPYIYQILNKAINGQINSMDSLVQTYDQVKYLRTYNELLFNKIRDIFIDAAKSMSTNTPDIEDKFKKPESALSQYQKQLERMQHQQPATISEKEEFEQLQKKINQKLTDNINLQGTNNPNKISGNERFKISQLFWGGQEDLGGLSEALQKLGLTREQMERYRELREKVIKPVNPDRIRGGFLTDQELIGFLDEAIEDFDLNKLKENGIVKIDLKSNKVTDFNKKEFKKMVTKYHFKALQRIHQNYTQLFQQAQGMSAYQYQYYFGGLQGLITNLCSEMQGYFSSDQETLNFLKDVSYRYQGTILTYAETFHNLPLYARTAGSFEKWPEFLGYLFPSELAEVFDPEDNLMEVTRREISQYLRRRIALNKNQMPADLFTGNYDKDGVRFSIKDYDKIISLVEYRMNDLEKKKKPEERRKIEDWELQRAKTYAVGIGLANLMDPEVICTSDARSSANFEGIYPLASVLSAKHNWGLGRGSPVAGLFPHLLAMDVTMYPEQRGLIKRVFRRKPWVPKLFHDKVEEKELEYQEDVFNALFARDHNYQELLSMINIATSLNSRHGWRFNRLKGDLKDSAKKINLDKDTSARREEGWDIKKWQKYFDLSMELYGTTSLWWQADDRVDTELKRFLAHKHNSDEFSGKEYEEYKLKEEALKRITEVNIDGKKTNISFAELRQLRVYSIRGETFMRYMQRNPGDFVMLLGQLCPDIFLNDVDKAKNFVDVNYFGSEDELVNALQRLNKTKLDIKKSKLKREKLQEIWGDSNIKTLGEIRKWMISLRQTYLAEVGEGRQFKDLAELSKFFIANGGEGNEHENFNNMLSYFAIQSGTAMEKAIKEKREEDNVKNRSRLYVTEDDFYDKIIATKIFGKAGLKEIFNLNENFGGVDENGKLINGDFGFFYRMGELWTLKQGDINPFAADVNYYEVYKRIGEVGEDVPARYLGDAAAVKKLIDGVGKLDKMLLTAALNSDLEKVYELHETTYETLKGIISQEYAYRANYILASIVAKFFWEHQVTRLPFMPKLPFDVLIRQLLGEKIALSKIITHNRNAFSMDTNAVRDYFRRLAFEHHVIQPKGLWSAEQLNLAFEADTASFVIGEVAPNILYFLFLYLMWAYIKKAMEEAEGKKK